MEAKVFKCSSSRETRALKESGDSMHQNDESQALESEDTPFSGILSAKEILDAIRSGEIRIAYYAIKNKNGAIQKPPPYCWLDLDEPTPLRESNAAVLEFLKTHLKPDSLSFTLGPLVQLETLRVLNRKHMSKRGDKCILNVEEAGCLSLGAREFVLVGTNEYIELSESIGASLYTPIRNTDIGLSHISTIIDPGWKGILQIGLTNTSKKAKDLSFLAPICTLRFHRLRESKSSRAANCRERICVVERSRKTWPHYQNNWWSILENPGKAVFPARLAHEHPKPLWLAWLIEKGKYLFGIAGCVAVLPILIWLLNTASDVQQARKNMHRLDVLEGRVAGIENMQSRGMILCAHTQKVRFTNEAPVQTVNVVFPAPTKVEPFVVAFLDDLTDSEFADRISTTSEVNSDGGLYTGAVITLRYQGELSNRQPAECSVKWIVISFEKKEGAS